MFCLNNACGTVFPYICYCALLDRILFLYAVILLLCYLCVAPTFSFEWIREALDLTSSLSLTVTKVIHGCVLKMSFSFATCALLKFVV